jgi:hypothetical protein
MESLKTTLQPPPTIDTRSAICKILGWSEEEHAWYIYESGNKYLDILFDGHPAAKTVLEKRKEFWNWWKNLWAKRDESIVENLEFEGVAKHLCQTYYGMVHDANMLACEIAPNRTVYGNDFITSVNKLLCKD